MNRRWIGLSTPSGRHRYERWLALSAAAVLIGLLAAFAISTRISLLTTRGGSMEPLFEPGDLAITTRADDYRVGDVVAYRTEPNGYMVLHRIVEIDDGRYTLKGDNNSFLDPETPTSAKIVGRLAWRIDGAGGIVDWMTTRTRALLVMVGAFMLVAGTSETRRRRRRGHPRRDLVATVQTISEAHLLPVIEQMLEQFPFEILGFHADNGSEYVNHRVAKMLDKLKVEFTRSRPRHSNDNGLAETKNGAVVRKEFGFAHIPQRHAARFNTYCAEYLNPFLNFHRPCLFATDKLDPKKPGRIKKVHGNRHC